VYLGWSVDATRMGPVARFLCRWRDLAEFCPCRPSRSPPSVHVRNLAGASRSPPSVHVRNFAGASRSPPSVHVRNCAGASRSPPSDHVRNFAGASRSPPSVHIRNFAGASRSPPSVHVRNFAGASRSPLSVHDGFKAFLEHPGWPQSIFGASRMASEHCWSIQDGLEAFFVECPPPNSMALHGIPREFHPNSIEFHGIPTRLHAIPWNSR